MNFINSLNYPPNFFIIGAAKAGTTRLHFLLGKHPEVFTSAYKEPTFFVRDSPQDWEKERYIELFRDVGGATAIGESSVAYSNISYRPDTARRIFEFNPQARIIYMVRHPLRRLESGWIQHRSKRSNIDPNFCKAVRVPETQLMNQATYWHNLSDYRTFFPDKQIKIIFFEEFIQDEAAALRPCFEFLGVDPNISIDCSIQDKQNAWEGKRAPTALLDFLRAQALFRSCRALFPRQLKDKMRPSLMTTVQSRPTWDEATWRWTVEQLKPEIEPLLNYAGRPGDYWNWELSAEQKEGQW